MKINIGRAIITDTRVTVSEKTKTTRYWAEFIDQTSGGNGRGKVFSEQVDLSALPTLVPVQIDAEIKPAMWGYNPQFEVLSITVKPAPEVAK